jgi:hypothetical protein
LNKQRKFSPGRSRGNGPVLLANQECVQIATTASWCHPTLLKHIRNRIDNARFTLRNALE